MIQGVISVLFISVPYEEFTKYRNINKILRKFTLVTHFFKFTLYVKWRVPVILNHNIINFPNIVLPAFIDENFDF